MEIIVFLWSQGGKEDAIEVLPLLQYRDGKEAELLASLHRADVDAARCAEQMAIDAAAIESTFGTAQALNAKCARSSHTARRGRRACRSRRQ